MADEGLIRIVADPAGMRWDVPDYGHVHNPCKLLVNATYNEGAYVPRPMIITELNSSTYTATANWVHRYVAGAVDQLLLVTSSGRVEVYDGTTLTQIFNLSMSVTESVAFNFNSKVGYTLYPSGAPREWDNSTSQAIPLTRPATGDWASLADTDIAGGHPFKGRVFYWSPKTNELIYTALGAIGGTLVRFPTETVSQTGGGVKLCTSLTMDGGNGPDDLFVIILTTGECLIYQGDDPGDAKAWEIVGRFNLPVPINANCVVRIGGDVLMLTNKGLIPLQQYIKGQLGQITQPWLRQINPYIERFFSWSIIITSINARLRYSDGENKLFVHMRGSANGITLVFDVRNGTWAVWAVGPYINDGVGESRYFLVATLSTVSMLDSNQIGNVTYLSVNHTTTRIAEVTFRHSPGVDFDGLPVQCIWETTYNVFPSGQKCNHARLVAFNFDKVGTVLNNWSFLKQSDAEYLMVQQRYGTGIPVSDFDRQWFAIAGQDYSSKFQVRWMITQGAVGGTPYGAEGVQVFAIEVTADPNVIGP
jgi:hypothetical protein